MISLLQMADDGLPHHMLLGLTGLAGSGKDTCASLLEPLGFVQIAFADAIRSEVVCAYGVDLRALTDPYLKHQPLAALAVVNAHDPGFIECMEARGQDLQTPRSARWLMQQWGTEYRRTQAPGYWIDRLVQRVAGLRDAGCPRIVVSDVRLPDEAACITILGGQLLRLQRDGSEAVMNAEARRHTTEQFVDAIAVAATIVNNGSVKDLAREAVVAVTNLATPARSGSQALPC